ncbi:CsiV family protein [Pseudidiomarina sp. PP-1MA]|uniref:CsiV family protein n=1 Tax=Pseudidiomarina sp. PP-1MA TaxID=3237706 RepID=A0AB39X3Q1_9GAMM
MRLLTRLSSSHSLRPQAKLLGSVAAWLVPLAVMITSSMLAPTAVAQSKLSDPESWRWFEVEVLVFKHLDADTSENFPWLAPRQLRPTHDLLSSYYAPDFWALLFDLPVCPEAGTEAESSAIRAPSLWCAQQAELDLEQRRPWYQPELMLRSLAQAPTKVISGYNGDINTATRPFLLDASQHQLTEMREQLERRRVGTPLLHVTYRTPVFTRNQNYSLRLFGGKNYGHEYAPSGYQLPPVVSATDLPSQPKAALTESEATAPASEQLFTELNWLLEQANQQQLQLNYSDTGTPNPPPLRQPRPDNQRTEAVWELDGLLHIYLVGNYLHIDSQLELREPQAVRFNQRQLSAQVEQALQQLTATESTSDWFLRSYRLEQLRRVISHETHYFDHPKLGLVVQIRRTDRSARR